MLLELGESHVGVVVFAAEAASRSGKQQSMLAGRRVTLLCIPRPWHQGCGMREKSRADRPYLTIESSRVVRLLWPKWVSRYRVSCVGVRVVR